MALSIEEQHVALPKLYGAPAYARPPRPVETVARPIDPDDLPIAAQQTDQERQLAEMLEADPYAAIHHSQDQVAGQASELRPRPFRLRALSRLKRR